MLCFKAKVIQCIAIFFIGALLFSGCSGTHTPPQKVYSKTAVANEKLDKLIAKARKSKGPGKPALWKLSDEDTTIYLFGTATHVPGGIDWYTPRISKEIVASQKIYFETGPTLDNAQERLDNTRKQSAALKDDESLSVLITEKDEQKVVADALKNLPGNDKSLDEFRIKPWAISSKILEMNLENSWGKRKNPLQFEDGAIYVLFHNAQQREKEKKIEIAYLQTVDTRVKEIERMASVPMKEQIARLVLLSRTHEKAEEIIDMLPEKWMDGDIEAFDIIYSAFYGYNRTSNGYKISIIDRNDAWVKKIESLLKSSDTVFIAVRLEHLVGPDSIIKKLKEKNHTVVRLD